MSDFTLDPSLLEQVNNVDFGNKSGGLPFPTRHLYALNGDARMANAGVPAMFFGGWATDKNDWDAYLQSSHKQQLNGLVVGTIAGRASNSAVEVYTTRSLYFAPVCTRAAWLLDNGKRRVPKYEPGARRHVQMLVVLADKDADGKLVPWGPAVLTAKGYQAGNIINCVDDWAKHTALIRQTAAPGVPAWLFWLAAGTFGNQRVVENVGSGAQKYPITPIKAYLPDPMTTEVLQKTYGGEALAHLLVDYRKQAAEWQQAWSVAGDAAPEQAKQGPSFPTQPMTDVF